MVNKARILHKRVDGRGGVESGEWSVGSAGDKRGSRRRRFVVHYVLLQLL